MYMRHIGQGVGHYTGATVHTKTTSQAEESTDWDMIETDEPKLLVGEGVEDYRMANEAIEQDSDTSSDAAGYDSGSDRELEYSNL